MWATGLKITYAITWERTIAIFSVGALSLGSGGKCGRFDTEEKCSIKNSSCKIITDHPALDTMDCAVLIILDDDRCNTEMMDGYCCRVHPLNRRTIRVSFGSNKNPSPKHRLLTEWKPIYTSQLSFRTVFQLSCRLKSDPKLEDQKTTSWDLQPLTFQAWLPLRLEMDHPVWPFGSNSRSHHVKVQSNCAISMRPRICNVSDVHLGQFLLRAELLWST